MSNPFAFQDAMEDALVLGNQYLAAEMGLGKSRVAIRAAKRRKAKRVLINCPAIGRISWPQQIAIWGDACDRYSILKDPDQLHDFESEHSGMTPETTLFAIVTYDPLSRDPEGWRAVSDVWMPDVQILDEAHYLTNYDSNRSSVVFGPLSDGLGGLVETAGCVWPMSGTPAPNFTRELWPVLRALAPQLIMRPQGDRPLSLHEFDDRYSIQSLNSRGEMQTRGSKNTIELRKRTASFFHRVKKADVIKDLPPVLWSTEHIALSRPDALASYKVPSHVADKDLLDYLRANAIPMATERKNTGISKVAGAVEWIENFLTNCDRKLIVFAYHTEVIDLLAKSLKAYAPLVIDGRTSQTQRVASEKGFQGDSRRRLIIIQIDTGGTSLTLTAANDVAFVEEHWTWEKMRQAAARADRIGQQSGVHARILCVPGTFDERVARVSVAKASEIRVMFG